MDFLEFLKSMNFDIGLGSLYTADSLLFRALDIPYIKITDEDIESHTMQFKLGMPVLLSTYPNLKSVANWDYSDSPETYQDRKYRWKMFKDYFWTRFERYKYMKRVRDAVPSELRAKILDPFDQDHALIINEGAAAGIFQSIMMKPANI